MLAASRLILDNFDHIKAYWVAMGEAAASVGLCFGADDLDGTVGEEKVMHAARAASPKHPRAPLHYVPRLPSYGPVYIFSFSVFNSMSKPGFTLMS